jgi:hypothetical protein
MNEDVDVWYPPSKVKWDLWMRPGDGASDKFLVDFAETAAEFGNRATFVPQMFIYDGCPLESNNTSRCANLCTTAGPYCDFAGDEYGSIGNKMVEESLRRIVIWSLYKEIDDGREWWEYIKRFSELCSNSSNRFYGLDTCAADAMKEASIDVQDVYSLMSSSGDLWSYGNNSFLEEQIELQTFLPDLNRFNPTLYINGQKVDIDELDDGVVFRAICSGYQFGDDPEVCSSRDGTDINMIVIVCGIMLIVSAFFVVFGCNLHRKINKGASESVEEDGEVEVESVDNDRS